MRSSGKILWWSQQNENGIIIDSLKNEYYFDRSVLDLDSIKKLKRNMTVNFRASRCDGILVAKDVIIDN